MSRLRIRDIGNSLGIIIPKAYSDSLGLKSGREVTIEMKEGALIIKPHKYTLEQLVAQMSPENEHPEISTGEEMGAEIVEYNTRK
ncbi:AbrB/MazE/SpoVT family DNA-binding domain-containing protein [Candidatus Berkiella aquae]|uniref:AbrB/MazE/SpoVT family DNA-binding domain-containing protein n=1 Tax=Candidatus Berkiella aquae TaxID=295108 RepID=A0A0Q9YXW3_9GAMM|nr:AbrB/MazE/SpoVT family DNA-binding domain-containing protein [Candidatus Berkiella aquae]MCS5710518.1 AbrB/MazE/SpoVT family DNA-binding domain-containing protein [Candidatus Berkiella aquae]